MRLLGNFLLAWFGIVVAMFGVGLVGAILVDAYIAGGLRALVIALAILSAFPALFIALWLRKHGVEPDWTSRPRMERWFLIAASVGVAAVTLKAGWNIMTDPPGAIRPCVFCSPYVPYQAPEPPPREPQK
jgi:hypothetical protein